jgi:hypothetical protein
MVFLLLTAYLVVRALDTHDWSDAALAGLVGGFAIGIKPSNTLFFGAAVLALLIARRWRQTAVFLALIAPSVVVLALWKQRGLGTLPAFASGGTGTGSLAAIDPGLPAASLFSPIHKYVNLDWHQLSQNLDGLREFFWAVRPLEFVPFAGLLAIGRRSWPKGVLVFAWFITFFVIKGTSERATIENASLFRLLMPSFPAFLLLLAGLPLLVPAFRLTRRLLVPPASPPWQIGNRLLGASAVLLVVVPLVIVAGSKALKRPVAVSNPDQGVYVPVRPSFRLTATRTGRSERLAWNGPYSGSTKVYYVVLRSPTSFPDPTDPHGRTVVSGISCIERGADASSDCRLFMTRIGVTRGNSFVDRPPKGRWTYRVALSANWVDNPDLGDMLVLSRPSNIRAATR